MPYDSSGPAQGRYLGEYRVNPYRNQEEDRREDVERQESMLSALRQMQTRGTAGSGTAGSADYTPIAVSSGGGSSGGGAVTQPATEEKTKSEMDADKAAVYYNK